MKIRSGILFITLLLSACIVFAQSEVDFQPKALLKTLKKLGIEECSAVVEMETSGGTLGEINGKYFRINSANAEYRYIYIGRVNSCRAGGCSAYNDPLKTGDSEYFDYYIIFDDKKTVQDIKVFNYQATYGYEVTAKGWLKQFVGFNGSESLQVNKNIDAISGATISVYAITADVQNKTSLLKKL